MPTWGQIQSQLRHPNNPVVFFDVAVGHTEIGRMVMEIFADVVPKTAENFRQFCTGEYKKDGVPIGFKKSIFHRVIKDFMIQGGDFVNGDGTGVMTIYGCSTFEDENFKLKHDAPGLLSMANSGKDTNGCQFFITCAKCDFLDGKHVVFGRLLDGLLVMRKIENVPTGPNNKPKIMVEISQCGEMFFPPVSSESNTSGKGADDDATKCPLENLSPICSGPPVTSICMLSNECKRTLK